MGSREDYERWRETEAARLMATGCADTDTVRELLILSCHSSPLAEQFFESQLGNAELLRVLLGLAVDDYSCDAQMTASCWVSRFFTVVLSRHVSALETVTANEWDSVSTHARRALAAIRDEMPSA